MGRQTMPISTVRPGRAVLDPYKLRSRGFNVDDELQQLVSSSFVVSLNSANPSTLKAFSRGENAMKLVLRPNYFSQHEPTLHLRVQKAALMEDRAFGLRHFSDLILRVETLPGTTVVPDTCSKIPPDIMYI